MRYVLRSLPRAALLPLAIAALVAAGCGSDDKNPAAPGGGAAAADVVVDIVANNLSNSYSPDPVTVTVGQTVAWRNQQPQTHTATSNDGTTFDTGDIAPGATSSPITMTAAGSFVYHCTLHPSMTGTLAVVTP